MDHSRNWGIDLLGRLALWNGERATTRFRTPTMGRLLAYLAYVPKEHRREELIERFWPDEVFEVARNRFRVDLSRLREVFTELGLPDKELLFATREHVQLKLTAGCSDVARFEALLKSARNLAPAQQLTPLTQAVALYSGPLLPGADDDWITGERQRLHELCLKTIRQVVALLWKQCDDPDTALDYARRAVLLDPLREEMHQDVIALLLELRRPLVAREHYHRLTEKLRTELGISPGKELERLFQQVQSHLQAPAIDPHLKEQATKHSHLPHTNTRFFGRDEEQVSLREALSPPGALVSLVGFGGLGKTRLALEVALQCTETLPLWVPFADTPTNDPLWSTLTIHLDRQTSLPSSPPSSPSLPLWERVVQILSMQPTLLILDNTEHLQEETLSTVIETLRSRLPELRCLITSRRRLNLIDERVFALEPLPQTEAPQLFLDRANRIRAGFVPTPHHKQTIALLCERLEGIPLAIEMAAARISILTPDQILARLDKRFTLLVNQSKDVPTHHRTLEATLDWSYRLLTPKQQAFLCALSVFRGGWTLDAAEAISDDSHPLEHTQTLSDASLIQSQEALTQTGETIMRYSLLETVRQFTHTQLSPEKKEALHQAHYQWVLQLWQSLPQERWPNHPEHENLLAALDWALEKDNMESALFPLLKLTQGYWATTNRCDEGLSRLLFSLKKFRSATDRFPILLDHAALLAGLTRNQEAIHFLLSECESILQKGTEDTMYLRSAQGSLYMALGDMPRSRQCYAEAHQQSLKMGKESINAICNVALTYNYEGNDKKALEIYQEVWERQGKPEGRLKGIVYCMRGQYHARNGDSQRGVEDTQLSIQLFQQIGDPFSTMRAQLIYAEALMFHGELDTAEVICIQTMQALFKANLLNLYQQGLLTLSELATKRQEGAYALQLLGSIDTHFDISNTPLSPAKRDEWNQRRLKASAVCPTDPQLSWRQGSSLSLLELNQVILEHSRTLLPP